MAFRATIYWRSMISRMGGNGHKSFATSTTTKMRTFAPNVGEVIDHHNAKWAVKGEFAPIYVVCGLVLVAVSIAGHTAKQQLVHSPSVKINKKKRESLPEVDDPDYVIASADKFINKSFLRKIAHIQDDQRVLPDTSRPDPFTRPRRAETLKSVGVNLGRH